MEECLIDLLNVLYVLVFRDSPAFVASPSSHLSRYLTSSDVGTKFGMLQSSTPCKAGQHNRWSLVVGLKGDE